MNAKVLVYTVLISCMAAGGAAQAHHSFAMFDNTKEVSLVGEVKAFEWTNPHCWVRVVVKSDKGAPVEWDIESASPNLLHRSGWTRTTLNPGDHVTIVVHPLKDGTNGGSLTRVTLPDGQVIVSR